MDMYIHKKFTAEFLQTQLHSEFFEFGLPDLRFSWDLFWFGFPVPKLYGLQLYVIANAAQEVYCEIVLHGGCGW